MHFRNMSSSANGFEGQQRIRRHQSCQSYPLYLLARRSPLSIGLVVACMVALLFGSMWGRWALSASASGGNSFRGLPVRVKHIIVPLPINYNKPVLAFYYMWYHQSDWCGCHMSDLPATQYDSSNDSIIDQQVNEAANAGITGFISSWWGPGDNTDNNFVKLLAHANTLEQNAGFHFASSLYFESDAPKLQGMGNIVNGLRYIQSHYQNNAHFFHWHGKPVLFFWDPLGGGRTLSEWASIRQQVDPNHTMIWSAEGVDMSLLNVFDGIHLFSAGYWGIQHGDMPQVDQGFRNQITAYNQTYHTQKIWAAGVLPGYDDTRIPGRQGTFIVPRNNGATYRTSWSAATSSSPDWITISTFNEWFEGAMVEPSMHYHNQYLDLTQQFSKQWHG